MCVNVCVCVCVCVCVASLLGSVAQMAWSPVIPLSHVLSVCVCVVMQRDHLCTGQHWLSNALHPNSMQPSCCFNDCLGVAGVPTLLEGFVCLPLVSEQYGVVVMLCSQLCALVHGIE